MKKSQILMAIAAVTFAAAGAFASNTSKDAVVDYYKKLTSGACNTQTECILDAGQACGFTVYSNSTCTTIVSKFRPNE